MSYTLDEMNKQCAMIADLRSKEAEAKMAAKAVTEQLEIAEFKMLEMLQQEGMSSYKSPFGTVSLSARTSVKIPADPESKKTFFEWLEQEGIYDNMVSVNSQKLNALYKARFEQAIEEGNTEFKIPGIGEPVITPQLSFRKK